MTEAVIVSTARTPIGKAYKGALNHTEGATLLGHAISSALSRAKLEGAEVEDVVMGCAMQQGTTGRNDHRSPMRVRPSGDCLGCAVRDFRRCGSRHRWRWRVDQPVQDHQVKQFHAVD